MRFTRQPGTALCAALLLAASVSAALAQEQDRAVVYDSPHGKVGVNLPEATDRGEWTGTWVYTNRDVRFALWLTEQDGKVLAKLRYLGAYLAPEAFESDWNGVATYVTQRGAGHFAFTLTDTSPDRLRAKWEWNLDLRGSSRIEHADVELFRAGDGRRLVLFFKSFERLVNRGGKTVRYDNPQSWTFTKVSRRLALWDELPL